MERRIGEIFTYNGKTYQVVESYLCEDCAFNGRICGILVSSIGNCNNFIPNRRIDGIHVVFKEINNMEIKGNTLTIEIPEGMEIDTENSDLTKGIVKFKHKNITYEDVFKALNIKTISGITVYKEHKDKLQALAQLMLIAKYYNEDWKPDWNDRNKYKYYIVYNNICDTYSVDYNYSYIYNNVYFKNKEDALKVINNSNFREILDIIFKN